jgi:hypothetical protein
VGGHEDGRNLGVHGFLMVHRLPRTAIGTEGDAARRLSLGDAVPSQSVCCHEGSDPSGPGLGDATGGSSKKSKR